MVGSVQQLRCAAGCAEAQGSGFGPLASDATSACGGVRAADVAWLHIASPPPVCTRAAPHHLALARGAHCTANLSDPPTPPCTAPCTVHVGPPPPPFTGLWRRRAMPWPWTALRSRCGRGALLAGSAFEPPLCLWQCLSRGAAHHAAALCDLPCRAVPAGRYAQGSLQCCMYVCGTLAPRRGGPPNPRHPAPPPTPPPSRPI